MQQHLHPPKHHGRLAIPLPRAGRLLCWVRDLRRGPVDYACRVPERTFETSGPSETEALGAELAGALRPGDVVLVRGELGAGKTTLVRGAARALGVSDPVTSPTFAIGHRYRAEHATVSHLDLYRLASLGDEEPDLLDDYVGPGSIAFVEWPHEQAPELGNARLVVTIEHAGADARRIFVQAGDEALVSAQAQDKQVAERIGSQERA
jgi:tRNA threonylcarbamoyladenosine biosynthesis protein TsaE